MTEALEILTFLPPITASPVKALCSWQSRPIAVTSGTYCRKIVPSLVENDYDARHYPRDAYSTLVCLLIVEQKRIGVKACMGTGALFALIAIQGAPALTRRRNRDDPRFIHSNSIVRLYYVVATHSHSHLRSAQCPAIQPFAHAPRLSRTGSIRPPASIRAPSAPWHGDKQD